jgi:hypothetical protein
MARAWLCNGVAIIFLLVVFGISDLDDPGTPHINCSGDNATVGGSGFSVYCNYSLVSLTRDCLKDNPFIKVQVPNKITVEESLNNYNSNVADRALCCVSRVSRVSSTKTGPRCKFNLISRQVNESYNMTSFQFTVNKGRSNEAKSGNIILYIFKQSSDEKPSTGDNSGTQTCTGKSALFILSLLLFLMLS